MTQIYGDGTNSSIGAEQFNDFYYQKRALIEARKQQFFMQLSDTTNLPKHMGKKIKRYHYLPLLDDANINDQGIDANGLTVNQSVSIEVTRADGSSPRVPFDNGTYQPANKAYLIGEGATAAAAADAAIDKLIEWCEMATEAGGLGLTLVGANDDAKMWDAIGSGAGQAYALGYRFGGLDALANEGAAVTAIDALAVPESGNLYGSSKDVGTISAKLPVLSEQGGRVNRVGFKRIQLEGEITKFGFFDEYTQESLDFDTDSELKMHINREMVNAAVEMTEDQLQIDLLNAAGVVRYGGAALATNQVTGEGTVSVPSYEDLMRLSIDLDNNRCPKDTQLITGTRNVDTKTVNSARYMYIGSELIPTVKKMKSIDASSAAGSGFVSVEKYGAAGTIARGEIGQVDQFKVIVVPEMMHWAGAGAAVTTNPGYRESGGNYNVYPMLVVGSKSFQTIGFQTDGKNVKFKIKHSKPGSTESYGHHDPFGEKGFMSIKWYYGTMILRPEHIALVKCVAEY